MSTKKGKRRERGIITEERRKNNKKGAFCKFQLSGGCAWSKRRQADLHETAVQPLAVHPQTTAVPCATALPSKLPALAYISDKKSCPERKKGTNKCKRSSSSRLRLGISEEHHARQTGGGRQSSPSHGEESSLLISRAPTGPALPEGLPRAPRCQGTASPKEIREGCRPAEAAAEGRPLRRRG